MYWKRKIFKEILKYGQENRKGFESLPQIQIFNP